MTRIEELLRIASRQELGELYAFWNGDGARPNGGCDVAQELAARMTDEALVRRRLRFLSRKLVDLLRFFLGRRQFEADLDTIRSARSFSFMSPHEVEAAVRALVKRGFLFQRVASESATTRFVVAAEIGQLLQRELEDIDLELSASFALARMLAARGDKDAGDPARVCDPIAVADRAAALPPAVADVYERALNPGGGLLPRSLLARGRLEPGRAARRALKEALESARLGTVRHLALGEYGINHFDETIILFEEVVSAELERRSQPSSPATGRVRSLGVDLLSDLALLLDRLTRERARFTQSGQIYRAAAKKIEDELILCTKGDFQPEELFRFLLDLALDRHLLRRTPDRTLELTSKGRTWPRLSVHFKLKELLAARLEDAGRQFHPPRLKRLTLERVRELKAGRWYDFALLVGAVRQRYLSRLDEAGLREAYQSRFQYSPEAHLRDLPQLSQTIASFVTDELHLLGLVDLALEAGRPIALCLTPLAVKALGLSEAEAAPAKSRLLVNSDFEVLLLPEGDAYDLIQRLDRFAERVSSEDSNRFRITPRSIERAVAGGASAAEILETLSAHSTTDLPQNLIYSVREYAEKVRFVDLQPALLLTARHREVIDDLLKRADVRALVIERLGPRVLALRPEAGEELQPMLAELGVHLEGSTEPGAARDGAPEVAPPPPADARTSEPSGRSAGGADPAPAEPPAAGPPAPAEREPDDGRAG